ncbi:MAG: hypothetical protein WC149_00250 [Arcobacteraceae bacterium]
MNIDEVIIKLESVQFQLEHHANYFENKFLDISENSREISNKNLEMEYFTYSKILKNLSNCIEQIMEIDYQSNKG